MFKFLDSKLEDKRFFTEWWEAFPDFSLLLISSRIEFIFTIIIFYYNQQMHNCFLKVYITTVSLCNLHFYMFRHFHVTIRQFATSALLIYTHFLNSSCWK